MSNQPLERSNAFGTATQGAFPAGYGPDERSRPQVMFLWLWWFVFSPVVLFMAPSYANRAKRLGFADTARYWVPFWLTLAGYALLLILIISAGSSPSYH